VRSAASAGRKGIPNCTGAPEYQIDFPAENQIDLVVADEQVAAVVETVQREACTGKIGDGKIFVYDVEQSIRISYR